MTAKRNLLLPSLENKFAAWTEIGQPDKTFISELLYIPEVVADTAAAAAVGAAAVGKKGNEKQKQKKMKMMQS